MLATSLAMAFWASVWLVPPYLVLMGWLLWPAIDPRGHARQHREPVESESQGIGSGEARAEESERGDRSAVDDATVSRPVEGSGSSLESDTGPVGVKTKRARTRTRKVKPAPVVEPPATEVTWIRVGPGKFVRVEAPATPVADEPSATPAEPEPADALLSPVSDDAPRDEVDTALAVEAEPALAADREDREIEPEPAVADPETVTDSPLPDDVSSLVTSVEDLAVDAPTLESNVPTEPISEAAEEGRTASDATVLEPGIDSRDDACTVSPTAVPVPSVVHPVEALPSTFGRSLVMTSQRLGPRRDLVPRAFEGRPPIERFAFSGLQERVTPLLRLRSRRGLGRAQLACRAFFARSPPRRRGSR